MNLLLLLAHSIEEHDQVKLLSELGYDVFSIGGYIDPAAPHDPKRPALPDAPRHPELKSVVDGLHTSDNLDAAKRHIPNDLIDWADAIIVHHYEHQWILPQWDRIKHKRVIWRTVGQSVEGNEAMMAPLRKEGLQIVRYSPKERNIPHFAGEDALIRFYKDPDEWCGWNGQVPAVINFTQHLAQRDPYTNYGFWKEATAGLDAIPMGPGSSDIGGTGEMAYADMQQALRDYRVYLYTGTQPASYTLGLIEAMMTGIPVVSIGPSWMKIFPYGPDMFEGHDIALGYSNDTTLAREMVAGYLEDHATAMVASDLNRQRAIDLFGKDKIGREWQAFLGS
jgi:hypothetical protein